MPLDRSLDVKTVRYDTLKVAKRLEAELGEDQASFIEGDPSEWDPLPLPEGSFTVTGLPRKRGSLSVPASRTSREIPEG